MAQLRASGLAITVVVRRGHSGTSAILSRALAHAAAEWDARRGASAEMPTPPGSVSVLSDSEMAVAV